MRISGVNFNSLPWFASPLGSLLIFLLAVFLFGVNARAADEGASLYKAKCAGCHGTDGAGQTPVGKSLKVPDLSSPDVQKKLDDQLAEVIQKGKGKMPALKSLNSDQIKQVVAAVRGFAKK